MTNSWPPPQTDPQPTQGAHVQKTAGDRVLEWSVPINRSGLAVAAGYVALFTIPLLFVGPIAVLLGILALGDIRRNPEKLGRGRAWFAIIYGGIGTIALLGIALTQAMNLAAR